MKIQRLKVGALDTNCYILNIENNYLIIDPGAEYEKIINNINGKILAVLITHYHFDHIGALNKFNNIKIIDYFNYKKTNQIGQFSFKMIKTPGHKEDLVSYLFDDKLFCGDFIFKGTIGRCELPGGNLNQMKESIKYILKNYNELTIYPGHGEPTTLSNEIIQLKNNII